MSRLEVTFSQFTRSAHSLALSLARSLDPVAARPPPPRLCDGFTEGSNFPTVTHLSIEGVVRLQLIAGRRDLRMSASTEADDTISFFVLLFFGKMKMGRTK